MNITKPYIDGLIVFQPKVFGDDRGYFFESFSKKNYKANGLDYEFVQDNISMSKKGAVRGLHYQVGEKAQGKLCMVISGVVLDVAVDLRFGSPTFGKYYSEILSEENHNQIWIPPGFAHGFSVLSETAVFLYKCTELYSKDHERAIIYNDPHLNIDWKVKNPIVSEKDMQAILFKDIAKDFVY